MTATTKSVSGFLAVVIVGLLIGWFLHGGLTPAPVSPVAEDAPGQGTVAKPKSNVGYCCKNPGSTCEEVASAVVCFQGGGRTFNTDSARCDVYCTNVKP